MDTTYNITKTVHSGSTLALHCTLLSHSGPGIGSWKEKSLHLAHRNHSWRTGGSSGQILKPSQCATPSRECPKSSWQVEWWKPCACWTSKESCGLKGSGSLNAEFTILQSLEADVWDSIASSLRQPSAEHKPMPDIAHMEPPFKLPVALNQSRNSNPTGEFVWEAWNCVKRCRSQ